MEFVAGVIIISLMALVSFLLREVLDLRKSIMAHERAIGALMVWQDKTKSRE